jgi:hypothetical protein
MVFAKICRVDGERTTHQWFCLVDAVHFLQHLREVILIAGHFLPREVPEAVVTAVRELGNI